jgi:hypothetical protein
VREPVTLTLPEWQDVADRLRDEDAPTTAEPGLPARIAATVACLKPRGYSAAGLGLEPADAKLVRRVRARLGGRRCRRRSAGRDG